VGDVVSTEETEQTELLLDKGRTSIRLRGGTSLEVLALKPRKEFRLKSGSLLAEVSPQKEPMLIRTAQAEAFVIGTEFVLATLPHSTRLEVASGTVRLKRTADGQALEVKGNEFATVAPQASFAPLPQPPAPWKNEDIGQVEMHGYAIVEGSRCLIRGAGRNTCLQKDQLHFMYQKLDGDFDFRARLVSFTARSASARAGIMVRRSLETACRQAFIAYRGDLQVEIQCRPETDSKEVSLTSAELPVWMRIVRSGDQVTFSISHDNENWTVLAAEQIGFGESAYTGLAVTSFDSDFLGESVFDQVTVTSSNGSRSVRLATNN
jgi:regulation of enolase protein 1 (concanavalin A-like superfamily)